MSGGPVPAIRPPVLRTANEGGERKATNTELFFDLVFVAGLARATEALEHDLNGGTFWRFAVVLLAGVWSWINFLFYAQRFDTDDAVHRLMKAAAMAAIGAAAVVNPEAIAGHPLATTIAFLAVRAVLLAFYARAFRHVREARPALRVYFAGFTAGAVLLAASVFATGPPRWILLVLGGACEFATPVLGWRRLGDSAAMSSTHLQDRLGQFLMIVLGDVVTHVVRGTAEAHGGAAAMLAVAGAAVLVVSVWWVNFEYVESDPPENVRTLFGVYLRVPIFGALAVAGVGLSLAIATAGARGAAAGMRWSLCGGMAAWMVCAAASDVLLKRPDERGTTAHAIAAAAFLALGALAAQWPPGTIVPAAAAILVALLIANRVGSRRRTEGRTGRDRAHVDTAVSADSAR